MGGERPGATMRVGPGGTGLTEGVAPARQTFMSWESISDLVRYKVGDLAGRRFIALAGELDLLSAQPLRRCLNRDLAPQRLNILDLSRVSFIDAAGMSALLHANRRSRVINADLVLRRPSVAVQRVLRLTAMPKVFELESPDWEEPNPDVSAILGEAVEGAVRISGAIAGNAQLLDPSGALHLVAQRGLAKPFLNFFDVVADEESACGAALTSGGSVWVNDVCSSSIFRGTPSMDVMLDAGLRAVASLPVRADDGSLIGMLSVHHARPTDWSGEMMDRLGSHARAAGQLIGAHAN